MSWLRRLLAAAAVVVVSACGAASGGGSNDSPNRSPGPAARLTFSVHPLGGERQGPAPISEVVKTLRHRIDAANLTHVTITRRDGEVVVSAPRSEAAGVTSMATQVGRLRFRQVLKVGSYVVRTSSEDVAGDPVPGAAAAESPSLTPRFVSTFAAWDCSKDPNPTYGLDDPADFTIACDPASVSGGPKYKYLLAPASVEGSQVRDAVAGLPPVNGMGWVVTLRFDGPGGHDWYDVTKRAYAATGKPASGFGTCAPPKGCNAVAIVLDGVVESAPLIDQPGGLPGGITQISGNFDQLQASRLADILKFGALPARLRLEP